MELVPSEPLFRYYHPFHSYYSQHLAIVRVLKNWFINTKIYKDNLESHLSGKGMTKAAKIRVMCTVTAFMSIGFIMMIRKALYIPCAILGVVWLGHMIYFIWGVKTREEDSAE